VAVIMVLLAQHTVVIGLYSTDFYF